MMDAQGRNSMVDAQSIIPMVTGPISVISSITIIAIIMRSTGKISTTYHRILFGISIVDIFTSAAISAGCLLAPADTPFLWKSIGNISTCNAQGFFALFGAVALPLYSLSLQFFFLCNIKYKMKAEDIQRRVEPFLHCIPLLYGMIGAITSVVTESINATPSYCYIEVHPRGCDVDEDVECTRGLGRFWLKIIFGAIPLLAVFLLMGIAMLLMYREVRKREIADNSHRFRPSSRPSNESENVDQSRASSLPSRILKSLRKSLGEIIPGYSKDSRKRRKMLDRIMQYYGAYLLASIPVLLANFVSELHRRIEVLFIISNVFYPLQGFYTLLVFIHPRYKKIRKSDKSLSLLQAFFAAIQYRGKEKGVKATRRIDAETPNLDDIKPTLTKCIQDHLEDNPSHEEEQSETIEESM